MVRCLSARVATSNYLKKKSLKNYRKDSV